MALSNMDDDEKLQINLKELRISSTKQLDDISKQICQSCGRKRMYFCYDCRSYMPHVNEIAPQIRLPVNVDIIKHPREKNAKSTALQCLLIAPESTRIFDMSDVHDYRCDNPRTNTVLVYPSKNAISIEDFILKNGPIDRFVFLDATWFQVGGLRILPEIQNLPSVTLRSYKTQYWRPQKGHSDEHLATIEAVYYAIREVLEVNYNRNKNNNNCADHNDNNVQQLYNGQIDDLLYWFYYFHSKVPQEVFEKNLNGRIVTSSES